MIRNAGAGGAGADKRLVDMAGRVPVLHAPGAAVKRWRCAAGHGFTGDAPVMALPLNPFVPPQQLQLVRRDGVCPICVLDYLGRNFGVVEVDADADGTPVGKDTGTDREA